MKTNTFRSAVNTKQLVAILSVAALALAGHASTFTGATDNNYATSSNWDAGVPSGSATAVIGSGNTKSAIYSTATDYTTSGTLTIGSGASGNGTLTLSGSAGTLQFGVINIGSGGGAIGSLVVNAGTITASGADLNIATSSGGASSLTVGGGTLNVGNRLILGDADVAGNTATITSGAINITNSLVFGGGGRGASTTGIFNLNGGTLSVGNALGGNITRYGNAGTYTFNFNGGTLKNSAATSSLLAYSGSGSYEPNGTPTGITYNVLAGGAIFDTTGGNATAAATLVAAVGNGGLTKNGGNTLTFSGIASSNAMNMTVNNGTLQLANTGMAWNTAGGVGNGGTVTIGSGATLDVNKGYNIGYAQAVNINGGTLNISNNASGDGQNYTLNINFTGGGSVTGTGALRWGELADATITVNGTTAATISADLWTLSTNNKSGTINVVDAGGVLNFNGAIKTHTYAPASGPVPLTKTGAGTLVMSGANTYTGTTTLNAGTIKLNVAEVAGTSGPLGKSAASNPGNIVLNGGYLQYTASNQNDYSGRFSAAASQQYNVDTNGQNVTWATALTSSGGSLTKTGTGTLTITGATSYTGATTVNGGTLEFGGSSNHSLAGTLAGSGALLKSGTGKLTLSGGGAYNGAVTINAGTLAVNSTLSSVASTAVASGAKLMGTGSLGGTVTVATGTGAVGDTASTGTLTLSALTFDGTGIVNAGVLSTTTPSLNVTGALTLNGGAGAITINMPTTAVGAGTFHLVGFGSGITDITGFTVGTTPVVPGGRQTGTLTYNTNYVDYVITGVTPYWTGGGDGEWNTTSANNWTAGGSATTYIDTTDTVTFDDTATGTTTVNIAADVSPATVTFNNSTQDYTLTGAAGIAGTTGLTKSGTGRLTMNGVHSYSGATTINGGTLEIGGAGQLGSGAYAGNISNAGTLLVNSTANQTLSGVISGAGAITKNNTGTLTITTAPTSTGAMTVNGGTLKMNFAPSASFATPSLTINSGGTLDLVQSDVLHWTAGKGALTVNGGTVTQSVTGVRQTIANTLNMTGGTLTSTGAGDTDGNYSFYNVGITATSDASGNAALVSANKISLQSATGFTLNVTRGSATPGSDLTISSAIANFTGVTGSMVKSGNGILTLTGANTYTGATSVNAGTLVISGGSLAAGGEFRIGNTGAGSMTLSGSVGTVAVSNASVQVGNGAGGVGTLVINAGTLQLTGTSNGDVNIGTGVYHSNAYGVGDVTVNGGALNIASAAYGRLIIGDTNYGTNTATLASGSITAKSVVFGGGNADVVGATTAGAFNLDGGTLTTGYVWRYAKYGAAYTFNFNGGTIVASGDNTNFLRDGSQDGGPYLVAYAVKDGGAIFDTQAFTVAVSHALVADGTGGLTKLGSGTLALSGANTFTGVTHVNAGTLELSGGSAIDDAGAVILANAAGVTLKLSANETIGSLSGGGTTGGNVNLQANTLTLGDANNTTYGGIISGTGGLTKQGNGKLTLSGMNTYAGDTTVNGGTLEVNGQISSTVTWVENGGQLQGTGVVLGGLIVNSGSVAPGGSIGALGIAGDMTFNGSATLNYELNASSTLGESSGDLLYSLGSLTIENGAVLQLQETVPSIALTVGEKLALIYYGNGLWNLGLFTYNGNPLGDGDIFTLGANAWQFDYNDTTGGSNFTSLYSDGTSFVTMTVVIPEPGTAGIVATFLVAALMRRRRFGPSRD